MLKISLNCPNHSCCWYKTIIPEPVSITVLTTLRKPDLYPQNLSEHADCVSPAKVAKFQHSGLWIQQQILGLDVPMTDPKRMDVRQAPEQLVHVQLHTETHKGHERTNWALS